MSLPSSWDVPFDKAQVKILRIMVDDHKDEPYDRPFTINWLWISQAVAAMEERD